MDIKLIRNAYGAAEYTVAYVIKSEPDTTKFCATISKALARSTGDMEHLTLLRRVASRGVNVEVILDSTSGVNPKG